MNRAIAFMALLVAWLALTGDLSPQSLALGGLLSLLTLFLLRHHLGGKATRPRALALSMLALVFLKTLALSVLSVTKTVLGPRIAIAPRIVAVPVILTGDFSRALLANLITLTPGTLSVDFSPKGDILYVHALDCQDPETLRFEIARGLERRIREAFP